jgi:peptidoglycan-associated lipoprotein
MSFMTRLPARALLVSAVLALGACAQGGLDMRGGAGGAGSDAGGPSDPSSPAYFNQVIGDRVLFEVDQSTLTAAAQSVLAQQAQWLRQNPEFSALIEGHADEQGTREYNLALGARRAASVQTFLIGEGIAENRLRTISYGKERPIEICSEEACYSQNRRAVTVVTAGPGA